MSVKSDRCEQTEGGRGREDGRTDGRTAGGEKRAREENMGGKQRLMPREEEEEEEEEEDGSAVSCCSDDDTTDKWSEWAKRKFGNSQHSEDDECDDVPPPFGEYRSRLDHGAGRPQPALQSSFLSSRALFPHITRVCPNTEET